MIDGLDAYLTRELDFCEPENVSKERCENCKQQSDCEYWQEYLENNSKITFHALFEQSGTFRDVFRSYGHRAFDYDIQNEYGKTDFQIDLFEQIEIAYNDLTTKGVDNFRSTTIFGGFQSHKDFIIAFFPCTMFTDLNEFMFRGYNGGKSGEVMSDGKTKPNTSQKNIERILERNKTRAYFYELWIKFCFIVEQLKISTIIENPKGNNCRSYVKLYSPWQLVYDEVDRTRFGDKFKKPTHFFAINFEMKENFQMYDKEWYNTSTVISSGLRGKERSEITPRYADNFYKRFLQGRLGVKNG